MSVVQDIARTYVRPRLVQSRRMSGPPREDRALAILMASCGLIFVAQWPRLSREAYLDPSIAIDARMAGALFGWILVMPLVFYALSLALYGILRVMGAETTGSRVRMGLFWALLASTPLWLLAGLMLGFSGSSTGTYIVSGLTLAGFLCFAIFGLVEAAVTRQETNA